MSSKLFQSESKFLERARTLLANVESHQEIRSLMLDYGMTEEQLATGASLYQQARARKEQSDKEETEARLSSNHYQLVYEDLQGLYKRHRDQVRIYFKKDPAVLLTLGVKGNFPARYREFFDQSQRFYQSIQQHPEIQEKLNQIKITPETVVSCLAKHQELLAARAGFDKEEGERQDATQSKNESMLDLKEWMEDMDTIAKVALFDRPQLLEVLGIFVRS